MSNSPDLATPRDPKCGILSVVSPVIGGVGFFAIIHMYPSDPAGFGGAFLAIYFLFGSFLFGAVIGAIGLFRRERLRYMGVIAFVINFLPLLGATSFLLRRI